MGNETSSTLDNYIINEFSEHSSEKDWVLQVEQGKNKDGTPISLFVYNPDRINELIQYINNSTEYLKKLRHPSILRFLTLVDDGGSQIVITERVYPLQSVIDDLTKEEICAGLHSILEALIFLHERVERSNSEYYVQADECDNLKGGLCLNNLSLSSIFVAHDGMWKLGCLEYLCPFEKATSDFLKKCRKLRPKLAKAPEEEEGNVLVSAEKGHARDAYFFGIVAEQLLREYLSDLGDDMTKTFQLRIEDEFLNTDPTQRPKLSTLLDDRLFRHDYIQITQFLKSVTVKSPEEKKKFFSTVVEKLYRLPMKVVATRLVNLLLSRFVLMDPTADDCLFPHLVTPCKQEHRPSYVKGQKNPLICSELFRKCVIPEIYKIFHVRDSHIRIVLLRHFRSYVGEFKSSQLISLIPQIILGLRDTNDLLVSLSMHALGEMIPILGGDAVIGPRREKVFSDCVPQWLLTLVEIQPCDSCDSDMALKFSTLANSIVSDPNCIRSAHQFIDTSETLVDSVASENESYGKISKDDDNSINEQGIILDPENEKQRRREELKRQRLARMGERSNAAENRGRMRTDPEINHNPESPENESESETTDDESGEPEDDQHTCDNNLELTDIEISQQIEQDIIAMPSTVPPRNQPPRRGKQRSSPPPEKRNAFTAYSWGSSARMEDTQSQLTDHGRVTSVLHGRVSGARSAINEQPALTSDEPQEYWDEDNSESDIALQEQPIDYLPMSTAQKQSVNRPSSTHQSKKQGKLGSEFDYDFPRKNSKQTDFFDLLASPEVTTEKSSATKTLEPSPDEGRAHTRINRLDFHQFNDTTSTMHEKSTNCEDGGGWEDDGWEAWSDDSS